MTIFQAKVVANNGDFRKAEDMMQKALLNSPVSVEYLTTFAHLKSKLKKYEQVKHYMKIIYRTKRIASKAKYLRFVLHKA
jgi:hypothetical protein